MNTKNHETKQIPIVEGYFAWPSSDPRLIGTKCKSCGTYFFPKSPICQNPKCQNKDDVTEIPLSKKGRLWSYTFQYYQPPPPYKGTDPFVPFGIGLVEFPEGIKVLGAITDCAEEDLKIGLYMEVVIEKMYEDELGNEYLTWKFKPVI